ncbi:MAG: adenylate/guanylate cyclase domain-containing protein [Acidimicrobiales bacterium]
MTGSRCGRCERLLVGDDRFVALLDVHNRVIQEAASRAHGIVFRNTGDGYGVWLVSAADALACAREIHDRLRSGAAHPPVSVRIGIAAGTAISLGGDLFGVDVVRAARLCGLAPADGTYVDAAVATAGAVAVHDLGPILLKGFATPEPVFSLAGASRPQRPTL